MERSTRGSFCINNAQICPQYHCTQFSVFQRKNMCLGVVPGYFYILFNSLIRIWKIARFLFTYEKQWYFLCKFFFSSIDKRECFKNLKYFENVSSICENNVNFVLLRVIHYTIVKTNVYGICKQDYINYMPVISKLSICWVHSIVLMEYFIW